METNKYYLSYKKYAVKAGCGSIRPNPTKPNTEEPTPFGQFHTAVGNAIMPSRSTCKLIFMCKL